MQYFKYQRRHDGAIEIYNDEFIKIIPSFKTDFMLLFECDKHGNRLEEEIELKKVQEITKKIDAMDKSLNVAAKEILRGTTEILTNALEASQTNDTQGEYTPNVLNAEVFVVRKSGRTIAVGKENDIEPTTSHNGKEWRAWKARQTK